MTTAERLRKEAAQRILTDQPRAVSLLSDAADELERLHALTEGDPTSIYAEAGALRGEVDGLRAENERLREAIAAHRRDTQTVDQYGTADYDYDDVNGDLWASLSETGGEGA